MIEFFIIPSLRDIVKVIQVHSATENMAKKVRLRVLEGGRDKQASVNNLLLKIVADTLSPLPVDVRVFEEDTFLVLTVDPIVRYTEEHPIRLMTKVMESKPNKPGSIVTNNGSWYAIVHDLDAEPTWRREWVEKAYKQTLMLGELKQIKSMGIPLLGTVYGNFTPEKSLAMLVEAIKSISFQYLKKVYILIPPKKGDSTWQHLKKLTRSK